MGPAILKRKPTRSEPLAARRHRSTFLGFQEVQVMLDGLRRHAPAVVEAAVPKVLSVPGLTAVLRALVDEGIPIKNLRGLLEAVAHAPVDLSPRQLVEAVRSGNKRLITHTLTAGEEVLEAFVVDREVEEMVRTSVRSGPKGPYLSLTPGLAAEIRAAAERVFKGRERPVVLASPDVRPYLREILVRGRPGVMVVSNMELVAELKVVPVGKVCVRDADPL